MSRILYDFKCTECGNIEEKFIDSSITEDVCSTCNSVSARQISAPRIALDGTDPGFPDAYAKWEKRHPNTNR